MSAYAPGISPRLWSLALVLGGLLLCTFLALASGPVWIHPLSPATELDAEILWALRWPRVQTAALVGALLALAGAWLQTLVGNPLAEPYVLGVAGSGSIGAIIGLAWFRATPGAAAIGAFIGAGVGTGVILPFVRLGPTRLLLAGVIFASFWGAGVALGLALLSSSDLGRVVHWMLGDLSAEHVSRAVLAVGLATGLAAGMLLAPELDRLALGERHATTLGASVPGLRFALVGLASLATGLAVAAAGTVGFVGLVVPHAARLLGGTPHRVALPLSAALGAALLMLADAGARVLIAPAELPVGVVTALIGVPVFLWLLVRRSVWSA